MLAPKQALATASWMTGHNVRRDRGHRFPLKVHGCGALALGVAARATLGAGWQTSLSASPSRSTSRRQLGFAHEMQPSNQSTTGLVVASVRKDPEASVLVSAAVPDMLVMMHAMPQLSLMHILCKQGLGQVPGSLHVDCRCLPSRCVEARDVRGVSRAWTWAAAPLAHASQREAAQAIYRFPLRMPSPPPVSFAAPSATQNDGWKNHRNHRRPGRTKAHLSKPASSKQGTVRHYRPRGLRRSSRVDAKATIGRQTF
mmetsp:Transcript_3946/g.9592  ORF Transcript_3946/g.9592 Transcript_3946/m.9592 type:complete len:256 (+) Transcript_3946:934-1701(+)